MNLKVRSVLILSGIFLAGMASGAFLAMGPMRHCLRPRPPMENFAARQIKQLTSTLDLTPEQSAKVGDVIKETEDKLRTVRKETRGMIESLFRDMNKRIKGLLTPEQLPKFEIFQKEQEARFKDKDRRRHGPDGPDQPPPPPPERMPSPDGLPPGPPPE